MSFYHHIEKYFPGIFVIILTLLIPVTLFIIIGYAIKGLFQIVRNRNNLTLKFCLPPILACLELSFIFFSPWWFDSESLESSVEMRACYEGTQNQSYIKFRSDKSFEIHSTGVFFNSHWFTGNWKMTSDTIFMKFNNEKNRLLSDTIIILNEYLIPIQEINNDSLNHYNRYYYLGYCKGKN